MLTTVQTKAAGNIFIFVDADTAVTPRALRAALRALHAGAVGGGCCVRLDRPLPPYAVLDGILECLVEHEMPVADIVAKGYDETTIRAVWRMLDRAEYKRRQAPPGVKITRRAFGRDRRYPITNLFRA